MTRTRPRRRQRTNKRGATTAPASHGMVAVARVGFDHGWLCLPATFLNLGLPVLVVDRRLLPNPALLGLEPFGSRNPRLPFPSTRLVVQHHPGAMISLWDDHPCDPTAQLLSWHHPASTPNTQHAAWAQTGSLSSAVVVIIGDTHCMQLGWAAIFDSHIGYAHLINAFA